MDWVPAALEAMRATEIPCHTSGRWSVERHGVEGVGIAAAVNEGRPPWTFLRFRHPCSRRETVMSDQLSELRTHLEAAQRAHGRVLVTGLGLGCVLRGVLTRPGVEHVDVVERDADVLLLVAAHLPADRRVEIHHADAMAWTRQRIAAGDRWDVAWHDLWSDPGQFEDELAMVHLRLMVAAKPAVGWQWAWAMPRWTRRAAGARWG